jgi:DNA replication protein DnaC
MSEESNFKFKPLSPEETERRAAAEKRLKQQQHDMKVSELRSGWGAWKIHTERTPEKTGKWAEKLDRLSADLGSGFLVALTGPGGTGKTQIGVELMKLVTESEKPALFTTAVNFFNRIKATYAKSSSETELHVLEEFRKPALLVIDEFSKRAETEWQATQMFELLNNRYGDMRDTLLIDNRTPEEFLAAIGPSLSSRMLETGGIIEANWESFRK